MSALNCHILEVSHVILNAQAVVSFQGNAGCLRRRSDPTQYEVSQLIQKMHEKV
jgi:hypothetical protein